MNERDLLSDLLARVTENVHSVLDDLEVADLTWVPRPGANPIGWLLWHLTRVVDAQVAELAGRDQSWVAESWAAGFGLAPDPSNHGYGHTSEEVAAVRPESTRVIADYYDAAAAAAEGFLANLTADDLDRVVDRSWDPPVTMGVRLVSILDDAVQHVGQAAYVKGLLPEFHVVSDTT